MKKRVLTLIMSLTMMLSVAACGSEPTDGRGSAPESQTPDVENSLDETTSPEESSALADWYDGDDRKTLEDTINSMFESQGLSFAVSIEEPDTIIYTYKYLEQLDVSGLSQDDIDALFAQQLDMTATTLVSDIAQYRKTYDIPLTTIRVVYVNADGSQIYSQDITEDYESPSSSGQSSAPAGAYDSLQAWLESDEAVQTIEAANDMLASSGMTMNMSADGSILVYEYYVSDALGLSDVPEEDIAASFDASVESQRASIVSMFDSFESQYGLTLDAVRFAYYTEDGSKLLYSADITNE